MEPNKHLIRLRSDGSVFSVEIDEVHEGKRDKSALPKEHRQSALGVLVDEGGVNFRNKAGKPWFMRFSEFEFVVRTPAPVLGS